MSYQDYEVMESDIGVVRDSTNEIRDGRIKVWLVIEGL